MTAIVRPSQVIVLISAILLTGTGVSEGTMRNPLKAIESSDLALVGQVLGVQMGTLLSPRQRWGKVEVIETLKGSPPSKILDIRLTDDWGQPSLVARLGTFSFWIFAFFLGWLVIYAVRYKKFKEKGKAFRPLVLLSVVTVLALLNMFAVGQTFMAGEPHAPSAIIGKPMLWIISEYEAGRYRGHWATLGGVKIRLECCKELIMKDVGPDTQRRVLLLEKYLEGYTTENS
jgi:hypothetical protein